MTRVDAWQPAPDWLVGYDWRIEVVDVIEFGGLHCPNGDARSASESLIREAEKFWHLQVNQRVFLPIFTSHNLGSRNPLIMAAEQRKLLGMIFSS
jgi:hypothetical protein